MLQTHNYNSELIAIITSQHPERVFVYFVKKFLHEGAGIAPASVTFRCLYNHVNKQV